MYLGEDQSQNSSDLSFESVLKFEITCKWSKIWNHINSSKLKKKIDFPKFSVFLRKKHKHLPCKFNGSLENVQTVISAKINGSTSNVKIHNKRDFILFARLHLSDLVNKDLLLFGCSHWIECNIWFSHTQQAKPIQQSNAAQGAKSKLFFFCSH